MQCTVTTLRFSTSRLARSALRLAKFSSNRRGVLTHGTQHGGRRQGEGPNARQTGRRGASRAALIALGSTLVAGVLMPEEHNLILLTDGQCSSALPSHCTFCFPWHAPYV